ncbi:heme ABC transporter ATP-binding protein [Parafilimonas sp.]|uniref:heme ABC transporter ATP-binding protein n=1 Tax=Parafilimonas sp. TaxID=1969739 RepID=UPI0039E6128B
MIKAEHIQFSVGRKSILHPMSFEVAQGKLTVLLGPNGAGKSTLLRLLAGEEKASKGNILINNKPLARYTIQQLALQRAVLTQQYAVPLPFSCEEIVMMGRYPHQQYSSRSNDKKIVERCMERMEVTEFASRLFHTLSGGEQQRVQLARVLAQLYHSPAEEENDFSNKILLLDEPTASMDYRHQQLCMERAKSLSQQGCTVLAVLHDLNLAARYADNIFLMKDGSLLVQGKSNEALQPSIISEVYETAIDIIQIDDYPFPVLIPSIHKQTLLNLPKNNTSWSLQQTHH